MCSGVLWQVVIVWPAVEAKNPPRCQSSALIIFQKLQSLFQNGLQLIVGFSDALKGDQMPENPLRDFHQNVKIDGGEARGLIVGFLTSRFVWYVAGLVLLGLIFSLAFRLGLF